MAALVQDLDVIVLLVVPEKMYSLVIEQDAMESLGQLGKEIIKFINLETSIFEIGLSFQKIIFLRLNISCTTCQLQWILCLGYLLYYLGMFKTTKMRNDEMVLQLA